MKNNGNVNFVENSIYLQILSTYLKRNEHFFQFLRFQKFYSMKNNGNVNFGENSINYLILNRYLKRN